MAKDLTVSNFDSQIQDGLVLVDFWADWCMPCRIQAQILDKLEDKYKDTLRICKVNVDGEEDLARRFNVQNIPTMIIFKNGTLVKKLIGVQSEEVLSSLISKL